MDGADGEVSTGDGADAADSGDGSDEADGEAGDGGEGGDQACPDCGMIRIYVAGDPSDKAFDDGLAGQTPFAYFIGVSSYQALRSADDPSPVLCFDYGADTFAIDLSKDNLVGTDPLFVDAARGDFRLKPDSPAYKLGFEPIPFEKIGRLSPP